jgi:hypothetical protein
MGALPAKVLIVSGGTTVKMAGELVTLPEPLRTTTV